MSKVIGIDLGTTNSCVAVVEGGKPVVITNAEGERTTPSVVAFTKDGERLVGGAAKRQIATNSGRTVSSIKRYMGSDHRVHIDGRDLTPQEISAMILTKIRRDAESYLGEPVTEAVTLRDGDMRALTVTVAGVFDNYVSNYAIVTPETCQSQWGSVPGSKTAFVSVNDTTDDAIHAASAQMLDLANVSAVTVNIDIRDRVATMMSVLDYIVWMVTVCAGALAFIVLYNLTNININERIREIATIKVLGFYPSETASYVFRENNTLVFLGMLLGLPLGKWLHAYVISQIKVDMIAFDVRIAPMSVVYSLLLTVLFAAIVDFVMYFRLRRISMAESLKSIE